MAASVWGKLDARVKEKGGTEDAIHVLDKPGGEGLLGVIADLLVKAELKTRNRFLVTIDYSRPLDQMIAAGKYSYVNENITVANFPITDTGKVETEIILVDFGRDIESDDAEKELATMGLEPAGIEHATAFGEKYPDVQREYPIVFLGSVWSGSDGDPHVPFLGCWSDLRELCLDCRSDEWARDYRFAAVRKVLPASAL
jgi:hypothetical protein